MVIHIVEDDPGVGDALALLLTQIGHESRIYPDAESFFECAPPAPQDAVIVDLGLPGVSGTQVIRWLTSLRVPPKIIAITGQSSLRIGELIGSETLAILLRKPLTEEALVSHL
ncbi:response regulator [Stappia sp.]|uniref:response regulator n=1 Tax=Stappia sp. TaxID=1870903 RepID=UPI003A998256